MISIAVIAKNEDDFIEYFLKHHLNLGLNKIYILDDNSYNSIESRVSKSNKFSESELLKIKFYRFDFEFFERFDLALRHELYDEHLYRELFNSKQRYFYNYINKYVRSNCESIFYIDSDEFLNLEKNQLQIIKDYILNNNDLFYIKIPCLFHGCNFQILKNIPWYLNSYSQPNFISDVTKLLVLENFSREILIDDIHGNSLTENIKSSVQIEGCETVYIDHFFENSIQESFIRRTRPSAFSNTSGEVRFNFRDRFDFTEICHEKFDPNFFIKNMEMIGFIYDINKEDLEKNLMIAELSYYKFKSRYQPRLDLYLYRATYLNNLIIDDFHTLKYFFNFGIFANEELKWVERL